MGKKNSQRQLLARALGGAAAAPAPAVPAACRRAQELFAQFKKGKKRAKAQEEAEAMYAAGASSALCIALAKMHMTLAVEQALKLDDDVAREAAVLGCLHTALQYAVTGAVQHRSIQCVVLCVFTLHCCRGRGSPGQKQQRQGWHAQLTEALPSGDKAKWGTVTWVDPRLESHATQDRFGFEWSQRGQHPTVEAWAEAVRDDWAKFMHKARVADTIDFKLLERLPTKNPDSLRELLHEVEQSVDRRLAGNVTPLNNPDKEALKQRLDALDARRAQQAHQQHAGSSASGIAVCSTGLAASGSKAPGRGDAAATAQAPPPGHHSHQALSNQWLPALHTAQLNKQRQKAELKRLAEAQVRAQQRAARLRLYLSRRHPGLNSSNAAGSSAADKELAASASLPLQHLRSAAQHLALTKELSSAEAELALSNLVLIAQPMGSTIDSDVETGRKPHSLAPSCVWYGDPLLSTSESRHSVEGYVEMEELLMNQHRQDWSMFKYGGQLVCRDVEGWQAVLSALAEKPTLQREPAPDLLLDCFSPDPEALHARVYAADLALIDACGALGPCDLGGGASDDDAFSDALSRQASLGAASDLGDADQQQQQQQPAVPPEPQQKVQRGGKALLQRVMDALKQQGQLEPALPQQQAQRLQTRSMLQDAAAPAAAGKAAREAAGQPLVTFAPAAAVQQQRQPHRWPLTLHGHDGEDLHSLFAQHHACEWFPWVAITWGYTQDQGRDFFQQWKQAEGALVAPQEQQHGRDFLKRLADAAQHAWLKSVVDSQLAADELPPETVGALQQMRAELWQADIRQKGRELPPFDFLHNKLQCGHDGVVLDAAELDDDAGGSATAATQSSLQGSNSSGSDAGSSSGGAASGHSNSGISWRSGSTGSSLPHLGSMAATDILDSYMRELLHNTLPCLDAILGMYSDAQTECTARLLPEDRLGEVWVEQMVRKGFAGHCMIQLIYALYLGQASRPTMSATMRQLAEILHGAAHPSELLWHFVTNERAAAEVEEAYRSLVELERRSQGRVTSRPVSTCTRMLAPLLLQEWQTSLLPPEEYLAQCKRHLARMTLVTLRHLHTRGRLMEGVLWQLNSYILSCLEKAREAAGDSAQQEELSKLWEELADVAHDNQDCFNYAAHLPLRMMLPLYTFVGLLCAEAFRTAADIGPVLEDIAVAEASVARLSQDGGSLLLKPAAVVSFIEAAAGAQQAVATSVAQLDATPPRRGPSGRSLTLPPSTGEAGRVDRCALLADYVAGVTEVQRAMQRLQAGGGMAYTAGPALAGVVAVPAGGLGGAASVAANSCNLAERSHLSQQLHRLLYVEAVLGQLFQRCEDISDGLEATSQVLRFMAKGLDEFIAGTLLEPLPPAPLLHVEQQLRDAQYALAAADCAQLALMLANERLRALCYSDTLAALREEQAARQLEAPAPVMPQGQEQESAAMEAAEPGSIAAAVERFSRLHDDMQEESRHDHAALQQLASSLAAPATIPLLKSVDLENIAIVDSVLQFAQNIGNASQPNLQPAIEQYRTILADKQAEAHERLEQVKAYVVVASRQLEQQRSQLGVLLEWCRIRQLALIGQLRSSFCVHSALDQLATVSIRAAAAMCWETEMRAMQELERQANMVALQRELEAEAAEVKRRAARVEKRKAQKTRKQQQQMAAEAAAEHNAEPMQQDEQQQANGAGNGSAALTSGSSESDSEQPLPQQQRKQKPRQAEQPAAAAAVASPSQPSGKAACKAAAEGKPTSVQAAAYQRMLEEFGLNAEAASFAQQLAAKRGPRQQVPPPPSVATRPAAAVPSMSPVGKVIKHPTIMVVTAKRPGSAPAGSSNSNPAAAGSSGGGGSTGVSPDTLLSKPSGARELMRVVSYYGDWICFCGAVNKLWDTCACGQQQPCRDWVRGICRYSDGCRFSHPPFDLPDGTTIPASERIAKPSADAPLYRKGQVVVPGVARQATAAPKSVVQRRTTPAAIVPMAPAVNAWQKPLQAPWQPVTAEAAQQQQEQERMQVSLQQPLPPPPPPPPKPPPEQHCGLQPLLQSPPPVQQQKIESPAAAAETPKPLQAVAPASNDTLLAAAAGGGLGWSPIGSAFELGGSGGLTSPAMALASADSSRAPTPSLGGSLADMPSASAGGDILVYPFLADGGSLQSTGMELRLGSSTGSLAAAAVAAGGQGPACPWEQRNGSLGGGGGGLGPTGDESAFLSQLMQGLDVGADEHGDADLASLLGPFAADVGQAMDSVGLYPAAAAPSGCAGPIPPHTLPLAHQVPPQPAAASVVGALATGQLQPSLLDGLALQQAAAATAMQAPTRQQHLSVQQQPRWLLSALMHCLWHCAAFRQLVLTWPEIVHKADPVVHALHRVFRAYADGSSAALPGAAADAAVAELADVLGGQLFGTGGALDDGGETLLGMYRRIREVESMRGVIPSGVHQCFGLQITEGVQCTACGKVTQQAHYTQYFVNVHAAALRTAITQLGTAPQRQAPGLGRLLRFVEDQTAKTCNAGAGGCGAQNKLLQLVEQPPRVVVVQLSWESAQQCGADIHATLAAAGEQLDLSQLYLGLHPTGSAYYLGAMLCHGQQQHSHWYQAFLLDPSSCCWLASSSAGGLASIGSWTAMMQHCETEGVQPRLLFYMAMP